MEGKKERGRNPPSSYLHSTHISIRLEKPLLSDPKAALVLTRFYFALVRMLTSAGSCQVS